MSSHDLDREVISAWQEGWYLRERGYSKPVGVSSLTNIVRKGWNSHEQGETCETGLENFMKAIPKRLDPIDGHQAPPCTCGRYDDGFDCRPTCKRAIWVDEYGCESCGELPAYCECFAPLEVSDKERRRIYRGDPMRDHQSPEGEFDA